MRALHPVRRPCWLLTLRRPALRAPACSLPIVICSRCPVGQNHDDCHYRGSRHKYEGRGFILDRGYTNLNPLQARTLLVLRLSAFGTA